MSPRAAARPTRAPPRARRPRLTPRRTEAFVALLSRVLQRSPRSKVPVEEDRMSAIEHLEALRRALIVSLAAWALATFAAFFLSSHVITYLITPAGIGHAIYPQPPRGWLNSAN